MAGGRHGAVGSATWIAGPDQLESGYWWAYKQFYRWGSIFRGARHEPTLTGSLRHVAYAAGWKKLEWLWDAIIRGQRLLHTLPLLALAEARDGLKPTGPSANVPLYANEAGNQ